MPLSAIFRPLTQAEHRLVVQVQRATQPISGWDSARTFDQQIIRAIFLRALLCGQVNAAGKDEPIKNIVSLRLVKALIVGHLDLSECKDLPHLTFENSVITEGIALKNARTGGIHLTRCSILDRGIDGCGLRASGSIELKQVQFTHRAVLDFSQANIDNGCFFSKLSTRASAAVTKTLRKELNRLVATITAAAPATGAVAAIAPPPVPVHGMFARVLNPRKLVSDAWSSAATPASSLLGDFASLTLKAAHIGGDLVIEGLRISTCNHRCGPDGCCDQAEQHRDGAKLAINAERVEIKGDVIIASNASQSSVLRGGISLAFAQITGHLSITGVWILRCGSENALNCEGVQIGGHFVLEPLKRTRTWLRGGLHILGGHIKGQLILRGVVVHAEKAITGDGVNIDNDLFIHPVPNDAKQLSLLCGIVRFPGATIGGQLGILGTRIMACSNRRSVRARAAASAPPASLSPAPAAAKPLLDAAIAMRDITVKGGLFFSPFFSRMTHITGGLRLNDAVINGVFEVVGTRITADANGDAIDASGANIKSDVLFAAVRPGRQHFENAGEGCQIEGTVQFPGATLGGRLRIVGASIASGSKESALIASGSSIKGGLFIQPAFSVKTAGAALPAHIVGTLRLNQAQIGSRFQLRGGIIEATQHAPFIAIMANGTRFAGDFILSPEGGTPYTIVGEIRMFGAEIKGDFRCLGGMLSASAKPAATGFAIDGYNCDIAKGVELGPGSQPSATGKLEIHGIVGFGYARLGCFTMGDSSRLRPASPKPAAVSLEGHIRLNGAEIADLTSIENAVIQPPDVGTDYGKDLTAVMEVTLNRWDTTPAGTVFSAQNADLGTMLSVRLNPNSRGIVDLLGAKVYTLDDHFYPYTRASLEENVLGWGRQPTSPNPPTGTISGVCLKLVGFSYTNLMSDEHDSARSSSGGSRRLKQRRGWLRQQYVDGRITQETFSPLPYIQLASTLRAQGFNREADDISFDRRKYLVKHGTLSPLDWLLQWLYGRFFGFGYQSSRALVTCTLLLLANYLFAVVGTGAIPMSQSQPWLIEARHPSTWPSLIRIDLSSGPGSVHAATQSANFPTASTTPQLAQPAPGAATHGGPCIAHKHGVHHGCPPLPPLPPPKPDTSATGKLTPRPDPDSACRKPWIYAIDQTLPVIHVTSGNGCEVLQKAPDPYHIWRVLMLLLSWIVIPTAALTFSGILRETNK